MKKLISILISIFLLGNVIYYKHNINMCKDMNYAVNRFFTEGIFNKYKLYKIDSKNVYFSNGEISFLKISGISYNSPYREVTYRVLVKKDSKGIWKIERVYEDNAFEK
ncbi:hypothetical protein H2684_08195 [Clostridium sp. cel8]|jgi:hypothetical protein|uniref:hypothetical protein n=1 Tax=Clostridium sp. cel8 TaxID=2663123 RepID=UPI0015F651AC|nr:hypothetical protein [Clostridium sp. cel8]MBA5851285.1 hypothetical protein [Clostridium sp. cel8]